MAQFVFQQPSCTPSKDKTNNAALINALGAIRFQLGESDAALTMFHQSLALLEPSIGLHMRRDNLFARVMVNIGDVHYREERWESAAGIYKVALGITQWIGWDDCSTEILCQLGDAYVMAGREVEAEALFDEARETAIQIKDLGREIKALDKMAGVYHLIGRNFDAISTYETVLRLCLHHRDCRVPISTLRGLAIRYCLGRRYMEAAPIFDKLQILHRPVSDDLQLVFRALRRDALRLKRESLVDELYEEASHGKFNSGAIVQWADALQGLGEFYFHRKQPTEALAAWTEEKANRRIYGDKNHLADALRRIGLACCRLKRYRGAELAFNEELDLHEQMHHQPGFVVDNLYRLAWVLCKQDRDDDAAHAYIDAEEICLEAGLSESHVDTLDHHGAVYRMQKQYSRAARTFRTARDVAVSVNYRDGRAEALKGLGKTLAEEEQFQATLVLGTNWIYFPKEREREPLPECNSVIQETEGEWTLDQKRGIRTCITELVIHQRTISLSFLRWTPFGHL